MTITLRNISPGLSRILKRKAEAKGTSLSKVVLQLLEEGAGIQGSKKRKTRYHDLDSLAGAWTREEAESFNKALKKQRKIDPEIWK